MARKHFIQVNEAAYLCDRSSSCDDSFFVRPPYHRRFPRFPTDNSGNNCLVRMSQLSYLPTRVSHAFLAHISHTVSVSRSLERKTFRNLSSGFSCLDGRRRLSHSVTEYPDSSDTGACMHGISAVRPIQPVQPVRRQPIVVLRPGSALFR